MTVALCTSACQTAGYVLSGVEYSRECCELPSSLNQLLAYYNSDCGNAFSDGGAPAPDGPAGCNMLCSGNSSEYCGGINRLDVYNLNNTIATITASTTSATATPTGPAIEPTISPYTYLGCQTEATNARALTSAFMASDSMTLEMCEQFCNPYTYFGVEYGRECMFSPH